MMEYDEINNIYENIRTVVKSPKSKNKTNSKIEEIIKSFKEGIASRLMIEKANRGYKVELYDFKNNLLKEYHINKRQIYQLYTNL